jgi:hypothetical protein
MVKIRFLQGLGTVTGLWNGMVSSSLLIISSSEMSITVTAVIYNFFTINGQIHQYVLSRQSGTIFLSFFQDSVTSSSYTNSASAFAAPGTETDNNTRRRFSNLSNLAQSLPSSSSCTSAFPVAGSIDLVSKI